MLPGTAVVPRVVVAVRQIALSVPATAAGLAFTFIAIVRDALVPHPFVVLTDKVPPVAAGPKSIETEFPVPLIV